MKIELFNFFCVIPSITIFANLIFILTVVDFLLVKSTYLPTYLPCSNEFSELQRDQFSYYKEQDQKFESKFKEHFSEQRRIDQEERQRDRELFKINNANDNK